MYLRRVMMRFEVRKKGPLIESPHSSMDSRDNAMDGMILDHPLSWRLNVFIYDMCSY